MRRGANIQLVPEQIIRWGNWNLAAPTCPLNVFRPAETLSLQIWGLQINGQDPNLANLSAAVDDPRSVI